MRDSDGSTKKNSFLTGSLWELYLSYILRRLINIVNVFVGATPLLLFQMGKLGAAELKSFVVEPRWRRWNCSELMYSFYTKDQMWLIVCRYISRY